MIRNIQDAQYGGRRAYADLHTPDYASCRPRSASATPAPPTWPTSAAALEAALAEPGPVLLEIDMLAIGRFKTAFAGPPVKADEPVAAAG